MGKKTISSADIQPHKASIPIVAIGASAGGVEAITELLQNLSPTTGFAFVYIQHLSPNHESQLVNILSRLTTMPVMEAQHLLPIEANHFYVIPADKDMEIVDRVLVLMQRRAAPALHKPIDQFFISLTAHQWDGAIGVVLSGMDGDGTLGLKAIKVAGGITFVQDESAKYQSMPRSAIAEGVVDLILSPTEIANEIERLSQKIDIFPQTVIIESQQEDDTADEDLKTIIQFIKKIVGVDFSHYKIATIRRRIIRRMLLYKQETLREYGQYLKEHPAEATDLYNDLLINVTNFFRDPETMDYLGKVLFPQLIKNKVAREPLRIWVPACSTGQETYSLAILLLETLGDRASSMPIHIFATDLSDTAITKARLGIYTHAELADVSPARLQRFFTQVDDHYRINKTVRDLCVFAPHNLLKDPPFSRLDMISCRNLLIYLGTSLQRKALSSFHYALNSGGYLLLGKSESVSTSPTLFSPVEKNYKVYTRKNDVVSRVAFDRASERINSRDASPGRFVLSVASPKPTADSGHDLERLVDSLLLSQYVPASVVVDQDLDILQFRGSVNLFLEPSPGKASLNLLKMARPSLSFDLRNAVHKARKSGQPVRRSGLEISVNDKKHQVAIEVTPLKTGTEQQLFLIIFEEIIPVVITGTIAARNNRIKLLEDELATLRTDMHSIIEEQEASNEELQSANEEIVSSNEELQSINEELETSKEEIESTNEELLTINQELQVRNDQLSESYEFAESIFDTIREATLGLDKDLRVKSANRAFYELFQVREADTIGRLIYELGNSQWNIPALRTLLGGVLMHNPFVQGFEMTHDFPNIGQRIMRLNARKVVQHQRQESILLAIEDTTEDKRAQRLLAEREDWFRNLIDNAPSLIWVAGDDGWYTFLNKAWLDYTGGSLSEEINPGWVQRIHPDDRTAYLATYNDHLANRQPYKAEYRLMRNDGEYRWMLEYAKPIVDTEGNFSGYIGSCAEVHTQKTLAQELDQRVQLRTAELVLTNVALERTNHELSQTAARLQSVLNGVPAAIKMLEVQLDEDKNPVDFIISAFNEPALKLTGTSENILNKPLLQVHPWMKEQGLFDMSLQVYNTGAPAYKEVYLDKIQPGYYAFSITPQVDRNGVVETILNITDRKNAQERMRLTAESLQVVLDSSPASIGFLKAVRNEQGEITDFRLAVCNQKFAQLCGQPIDSLLDQSVSNLSYTLWQENTVARFIHIVSSGESYYEERLVENQFNQQNGQEEWLGLSVTKQEDGVVVTGLDITALKDAEQQQSHLLQELGQSENSLHDLEQMRQQIFQRGEFLRSTTHDLRGGFGIIQGAATLLDFMDTEEERAQILTMLQRNLRQVTQMLSQLLDYSRLESGQEHIIRAPFDLAELLVELKEGMMPLAMEHGLWLRTDGPGQLLVESDAIKIQRIAQNLLLNALKYTQTGGVTIAWGHDEMSNGWQFSIQDTGPGLPAALVKLLMVQSTDVPEDTLAGSPNNSTGEGIGLFIVKRLSMLLDATLTVESKDGAGTLFQLHFS